MAIDVDKDKCFHDGDGDEPDDDDCKPWCLHITRVGNGFMVDGSECPLPAVFEETGDVNGNGVDVDAFARLLDFIMEYFGAVGTKHDAKRLRIVVEPGSDYKRPN